MTLAMRTALTLLALPDLSVIGLVGVGRFIGSAAALEAKARGGLHLRASREDRWRGRAREEQSCSVLRNRGTHFTVEIEVGTPGQRFDVVADTGSDSVIVESCVCAETHRCSSEDKCFRGTNHSSSFYLRLPAEAPGSAVVLTFGSGQIEAIVASDVVRVGRLQVPMPDGVLLMSDRALDISGPFEGILGLGLPQHDGPHGSGDFTSKGFLEAAGVPRFSMCFNGGADGVLRLGTPAVPGALGSIGEFHWGLDLQGVSVGNSSVPVQVCSPASMRAGQQTACGAIPDSGTTLIMAPARHLQLLFTELCDQWERCHNASADSQRPKHELFQTILLSCEEWLTDDVGLHELPPVHFHLAGADGAQRTIRLDGPSYVLATKQEEMRYVTQHLFGVFPLKVAVPTGRVRDVCLPGFGSHHYNTQKNGPVWILGTPLFYEFQVGYNLQSTPPSISLLDEPCGACEDGAALVSSSRHVSGAASHAVGRPRHVHGPMRIPKLNTSLPL